MGRSGANVILLNSLLSNASARNLGISIAQHWEPRKRFYHGSAIIGRHNPVLQTHMCKTEVQYSAVEYTRDKAVVCRTCELPPQDVRAINDSY